MGPEEEILRKALREADDGDLLCVSYLSEDKSTSYGTVFIKDDRGDWRFQRDRLTVSPLTIRAISETHWMDTWVIM